MDHVKSMLSNTGKFDELASAEEVLGLYGAIFEDCAVEHPAIRSTFERDYSRLQVAVVENGLPFFTIALPTAGKWFDHCLSEGRLVEPRPPHFGVKGKGDRRPAFLNGLFSLIFEPDGTLLSTPDISAIKSTRQVLLVLKKLEMECESKYTAKAVEDFHEIEKSLPAPRPHTWNSDIPSWSSLSGHPIWGVRDDDDRQTHMFDVADPLLQLDFNPNWEGLRRFSARVLSEFGEFEPAGIREKHGPGAVSDREATYVKYDFKYWTERLESVFPYDWHASSDYSVPAYVTYREFASQMHAVPKTQSGPRLIAAEPTCHQWIQQGILRWLEAGISSSVLRQNLDLRDQEPSRAAALEASRSGLLTTVDLSSASDRLSCRLVEFLFQVNRPLLDGLHASRTRALRALDGELVLLKKFASQGSAVIFPVQSIVYTILALWACGIASGKTEYHDIIQAGKQVRVFGDDIIVPKDAYPVLAGLLKTCLLKVNALKTHDSGFFRESCGMDAYANVDVTPAYLRKFYRPPAETLASVAECSNNFHKRGFWRVAQWLDSTIPASEFKLMPVGEGFGAIARFSFCGNDVNHLRSRENVDLHRPEVRILDVTSRDTRRRGDGNGSLTQFLREQQGQEFGPEGLDPLTGAKERLEPSLYQGGQASRKPRMRKRARWVPTNK